MGNFRSKANRTYKHQRKSKIMIVGAVIALILFFYFGYLFGLFYMIKLHTNEFLILSKIKLEDVRSGAIAEYA